MNAGNEKMCPGTTISDNIFFPILTSVDKAPQWRNIILKYLQTPLVQIKGKKISNL